MTYNVSSGTLNPTIPWSILSYVCYHDCRVSLSRRTFGPSSVNVHAWLAATPQLTKCIWTMAVAQHQFYLDRKQSEVRERSTHFPVHTSTRAWNSLPLETRACSSLLTFRRETKSYLFRQSYSWRGAVCSDGQRTSALSCATVLYLDFVKCPYCAAL